MCGPPAPSGPVWSPSVSMGQRESMLVQTSRTLAWGSTPQRLARPGGFTMNTSDMFIGIDVSNTQLDIAVRPTHEWCQVANTPRRHRRTRHHTVSSLADAHHDRRDRRVRTGHPCDAGLGGRRGQSAACPLLCSCARPADQNRPPGCGDAGPV